MQGRDIEAEGSYPIIPTVSESTMHAVGGELAAQDGMIDRALQDAITDQHFLSSLVYEWAQQNHTTQAEVMSAMGAVALTLRLLQSQAEANLLNATLTDQTVSMSNEGESQLPSNLPAVTEEVVHAVRADIIEKDEYVSETLRRMQAENPILAEAMSLLVNGFSGDDPSKAQELSMVGGVVYECLRAQAEANGLNDTII